jgi:hypothetical protein
MSKGSVLEWNKRFHKKGDVHDNSWSCQLTIVITDENAEKVWQWFVPIKEWLSAR